MNPNLEIFLYRVAFLLPVIIAAIGGLVWAGMNWKKASTPAMATTIACATLVLFSCIFPALAVWVPPMMRGDGVGRDAFTRMIWTGRAVEVCSHSCTALCIGALIFAAFANRAATLAEGKKARDAKRKRQEDDDADDDEGDTRTKRKSRSDDD